MSKSIRFIFSVIPLLALSLCVAQSEPHHASKQQMSFSAGEEFEHPVALPSGALKALETSKLSAEMLRGCAADEGIKINEIPASWFVGSWIELRGGRSSGLVVSAKQGCFWGAHISQFWLLSKNEANYYVVFTGRADGFRVLSKRTNGYRDVQLIFAAQAGAEITFVTFEYANGEYVESDSRTERPYDN
ncbi:MAG: hypothetical protein ACLQBK_14845 [Candidatus Sulfotelmatobacter sp.]